LHEQRTEMLAVNATELVDCGEKRLRVAGNVVSHTISPAILQVIWRWVGVGFFRLHHR
jgi:hypothetical protein